MLVTNKDKLYYALQFANPEDYKSTGKRDKDNNQIFNISDEEISPFVVISNACSIIVHNFHYPHLFLYFSRFVLSLNLK